VPIIEQPSSDERTNRSVRFGDVEIWPSRRVVGQMFVHAIYDTRAIYLVVPDWFMRSWQAGEPIEGLLDYLLERYGDEFPVLVESLAEAMKK
jgi:hypothetical protein